MTDSNTWWAAMIAKHGSKDAAKQHLAAKRWATLVAKHGSDEAVRQYMRDLGAKSSRNKGKKGGFASMTEEQHKAASSKGGKGYSKHAASNTVTSEL